MGDGPSAVARTGSCHLGKIFWESSQISMICVLLKIMVDNWENYKKMQENLNANALLKF